MAVICINMFAFQEDVLHQIKSQKQTSFEESLQYDQAYMGLPSIASKKAFSLEKTHV